jgi:hypothetical protein
VGQALELVAQGPVKFHPPMVALAAAHLRKQTFAAHTLAPAILPAVSWVAVEQAQESVRRRELVRPVPFNTSRLAVEAVEALPQGR